MGTGKMPSKMQMLRLATNSDFRTAATKVVEELKKAGVDLNSAVRHNTSHISAASS